METKCLPAGEAAIRLAAELIKKGECVALPTETVYGLAANALDGEAVMRIFAAKNRPADNPLIVHISGIEELSPLVKDVPEAAKRAMDAFWPGPLTLILQCSPIIPREVTAGHATVAVRLPAHPVMLAVIKASGCPLAAPSANRSGGPSPTRASHVMEDLSGRIPLVVDGGPCEVGLESTVIDVSDAARPPALLRPGFVTLESLRDVLGDVDDGSDGIDGASGNAAPRSPGMKYRHYAPNATLMLVRGGDERETAGRISALYDESLSQGKSSAVLCYSETKEFYAGRRVFVLGSRTRMETVAHSFFHVLRVLDSEGVDAVFCEPVEESGLGLAVMNRLTRAAGFNFAAIE